MCAFDALTKLPLVGSLSLSPRKEPPHGSCDGKESENHRHSNSANDVDSVSVSNHRHASLSLVAGG